MREFTKQTDRWSYAYEMKMVESSNECETKVPKLRATSKLSYQSHVLLQTKDCRDGCDLRQPIERPANGVTFRNIPCSQPSVYALGLVSLVQMSRRAVRVGIGRWHMQVFSLMG